MLFLYSLLKREYEPTIPKEPPPIIDGSKISSSLISKMSSPMKKVAVAKPPAPIKAKGG